MHEEDIGKEVKEDLSRSYLGGIVNQGMVVVEKERRNPLFKVKIGIM